MLESWELKHGLDEIERRLDDGLFKHDPELQRQSRAWVRARRAAPWVAGFWKLAVGAATIVGAFAVFK